MESSKAIPCEWSFYSRGGKAMTDKLDPKRGECRSVGIFVHNELWDLYLPLIGGKGALLYCYLLRQVDRGQEICYDSIAGDLGLTYRELQETIATLVEYELVSLGAGNRLMINSPKDQQGLAELLERRQESRLNKEAIMADITGLRKTAILSTLQKNRDQKTIFSIVEQEFGRPLRPAEFEMLQKMEGEYQRELILEAVSRAVLHQAYNVQYIESILFNWKMKGIKTLTDVERDDQRFRERKARRSGKSVANLTNHHPEQARARDKEDGGDKYSVIYKKLKQLRKEG